MSFFSIVVFRRFFIIRTVCLNHWFVSWCFLVQFSLCFSGKFSIRVPSGRKKQIPSTKTGSPKAGNV
jgi:hypothetical protein